MEWSRQGFDPHSPKAPMMRAIGALDKDERDSFDRHAAICPECAKSLDHCVLFAKNNPTFFSDKTAIDEAASSVAQLTRHLRTEDGLSREKRIVRGHQTLILDRDGEVMFTLGRVLRSKAFGRAPKQRDLLKYLVEAELRGVGKSITESTLQDSDLFSQATGGSTVRGAMCRLRRTLERYYGDEGCGDVRRFSIPTGHCCVSITGDGDPFRVNTSYGYGFSPTEGKSSSGEQNEVNPAQTDSCRVMTLSHSDN
jgi:hypothetical protein